LPDFNVLAMLGYGVVPLTQVDPSAPADLWLKKSFVSFCDIVMEDVVAPAEAATAPPTSTVQVRLITKTETPISSTPIVIPTNVTRYSLSQILNHLLENPQPIPYSFLINSVYLPASLDEYITENGISREEILEIEYVRSMLPPQWEGQWTQEDWVSGVCVREEGVVSSGYDGVVRVWDWSGNVVAKSRGGQGPLRSLKCVKWIDGGFVTGGMDGSVRVWSYSDSAVSLVVEGKGHEASVDDVDYRDAKAISAGADGTLRVWSMEPSEAEAPQSQRKKRRTESAHAVKV
jgi:ribosome biogenesis protein